MRRKINTFEIVGEFNLLRARAPSQHASSLHVSERIIGVVVGVFVVIVVGVARHRVALNVCHEGLCTDSFKKQPGGLKGEPVVPDAGVTGHRIVRRGGAKTCRRTQVDGRLTCASFP